MCLVGIVLFIAFTAVCINAYQKTHEEVIGALNMALENTKEEKPTPFEIGSPNTQRESSRSEAAQNRFPAQYGLAGKPFSYAAVVLLVSDDNGTRQVTTLGMMNASMNDEVIKEAVEAVMSSDEKQGRLADMELFYMKSEDFLGTKIAFADSTYFDEDMRKTVITSAVTFVVVMTALFFISLFLAGVAVAPVKKAWEKQRRFVADASHELKTPLTVLLANNEIMMSALDDIQNGSCVAEQSGDACIGACGSSTCDDDSSPVSCELDMCGNRLASGMCDMRRWLESSHEEAVQMKGLVDDLLFLARADEAEEAVSDENAAANAKAVMSDSDISDIVMGAALQMEPVAFEAGVNMITDVEAGIHMRCDAAQMKRLVHILLDNAVKYCAGGDEKGSSDAGDGVSCGMVSLKLSENAGRIELAVTNTGNVIDSGDIEHIFDRFYRSDKARTGSGYGLGLSIAKTITGSHGGQIKVYSGLLDEKFIDKPAASTAVSPADSDRCSEKKLTGTVMTVVFAD